MGPASGKQTLRLHQDAAVLVFVFVFVLVLVLRLALVPVLVLLLALVPAPVLVLTPGLSVRLSRTHLGTWISLI